MALLLPIACSGPPPSASPPPGVSPPPQEARPRPEVTGKVWMATDPAAAPGTFRVFLPNGTLVMDSCGETYRLARWRFIDDRRIEWTEDTARIEAEVARLTDDELQLKVQLVGEMKEERFRTAQVPWVCPEMPRGRPMTNPAAPVSPVPTAYRCGDETFRIAFEEGRAYVTMPDGSLMTLDRLSQGGDPQAPRTFTNGRLTFFQETEGVGGPRVRFARGRMALTPCTRVD